MAGEKFGSDQFLVYDLAEGGAGYSAAGYVTGGDGLHADYDELLREGISDEQVSRDGLIDYAGSAEIDVTPDTFNLIEWILEAVAGAWRPLKLGGDLGNGVAEHTGAYATKASLKIATGDSVSLALEWLASGPGIGTPARVAIADPWNLESYESASTFAGAKLGVQSVTYNVEFAVQYVDDNDGREEGEKRTHRGLVHKGIDSLSVDAEVIAPPSIDWTADYPASNIAVQSTMTNNAVTPKTLGIQVPNLRWVPPPKTSYKPGRKDLVVWSGTLKPRFLSQSIPVVTIS